MADENLSFPPEYDSYYQLLLQKTAEEHGPSETPLTNFWPARGSKCSANAALVIVGRAVNGLDEGWLPVQVISPEARIEMLSTMRKASEGCHSCPLSWVTKPPKRGEYNPNRSAFWRLGRNVYHSLCGVQPDWSSNICWTNLFKLSPAAGGNPSGRLQETQRSTCIELLKLEISAWNPKIVLVLTGRDWFKPFAEEMQIDLVRNVKGQLVQQIGHKENTLG